MHDFVATLPVFSHKPRAHGSTDNAPKTSGGKDGSLPDCHVPPHLGKKPQKRRKEKGTLECKPWLALCSSIDASR